MVVPDKDSNLSKKEQVAGMFDRIAARYDFLNHFLSLNIDKSWRRRAIRAVMEDRPAHILDVATGTGDMAIAAAQAGAQKITGVDISEGMLAVGNKKIEARHLAGIISLQTADSEALPFENETFDAIMCAYGVRNFENLENGLKEMMRTLKPGGRLTILEFSKPKSFPAKQFFAFHSRVLLPFFGNMISRDKRAYTYLPESVEQFPEGNAFLEKLKGAGFSDEHAAPLTFGITTLYTAMKR